MMVFLGCYLYAWLFAASHCHKALDFYRRLVLPRHWKHKRGVAGVPVSQVHLQHWRLQVLKNTWEMRRNVQCEMCNVYVCRKVCNRLECSQLHLWVFKVGKLACIQFHIRGWIAFKVVFGKVCNFTTLPLDTSYGVQLCQKRWSYLPILQSLSPCAINATAFASACIGKHIKRTEWGTFLQR